MKRRKFWLRAAGVLVVLLVLARFIGVAMLPGLIDSALRDKGFSCEIEHLHVSLFAGEVRIRDLVVGDIENEATPLLVVQHVSADLDMSSLLGGELVLHRAEIDGVVLDLRRSVEDGWNFERLFAGESASEPVEDEPAADGAYDLSLPIRITSLRAQDLHVHLADGVSEPRIETELTLNLTASNLGGAVGEGNFELIGDATNLLDFVRVKGVLEANEKAANLRTALSMRGIRPGALEAWLHPIGLQCLADAISVRGELTVNAEVSGEDGESLTVTVDTRDWAVQADGVEALAMDFSHHVIEVDQNALRESELTGLRAGTGLEEDGALSMAGLAWLPVSGTAAVEPEKAEVAAEPSPPVNWRLDALRIREASLIHADARSNTDVELRLDGLDLTDFDSERRSASKLDIQLSSPGIFEKVHIQGTLTPAAESLEVAASFDLVGCSPERCQAMLEPTGIELRLVDATAHGAVAATIERGQLAGSVELSDLWMASGEQRTSLDIVRVDRFSIGNELQVGKVLISGMRGTLELHENGDFELGGLVLVASAEASATAPPAAEVREVAEVAEHDEAVEVDDDESRTVIRLEQLTWNDLQLAFVDHAVRERSFSATSMDLDIQDFALGVETACSVHLRADFDGWCEQLELEGSLRSKSQGDLDADLALRVSGLSGEQFALLSPDARAFETGEFLAHLSVDLKPSPEGLVSSLVVKDLALTLDQEPIVSLSEIAIDDVVAGADGLRLGGVRMDGARLLLHKEEPEDSTNLALSAELGELRIGSSESTEFTARVALEGGPAVVELSGEVRPDLEDLLLVVHVAGSGLDGAGLDRHLPQGIGFALEDGVFQADVEAWFKSRDMEGFTGGVAFDDIRLSEASLENPVLALQRVELSASKIDLESDTYELGQLHVRGLEVDVVREADGALHFAGLRMDPNVNAAETELAPLEEVEVVSEVKSAPNWVRKYDTAPLPTVLLESLDLELAALRFEDRSHPGSVPATFSARFHHDEALVLLSPEAESLPPMEFVLECSAQPVAESLVVNVLLAPWEDDPRIKIDVNASGLQGAAVTELVPALKTQLDGSGLVDGAFTASFESRLLSPRRNLIDFEFRNGLGLEFALRDLALRNGEGEKPLASLGAIEVEVERVNLETGALKIANVEVSNLQAQVKLSERGREALGFTILSGPEPAPIAEGEEPEEPVASEPYTGPEIEIERVSIEGLDLVLTDERTTPATVLPVDSLSFDLERFTTKTFTEARPFRFAFYMGAGDMRLPKAKEAGSVLSGLAGAAMSAATGAEDEFEYEYRPALGELALNGSLSFGPKPRGRVNLNLEGLELLGFAGLARESGVIIGDGVLNSWVRVELKGSDGIDVRSSIVFTDLSLDEPPNGPISRYLKLPASLDAVLFAIKNNDDEHRIPLNFHADVSGIGKGEVTRVAVTTLTRVLTSAVASAPLRVGDSVAGLLTIPGVEENPVGWVVDLFLPILRVVGLAPMEGPESDPIAFEYSAGEFVLEAGNLAALEPILEELRDRQDFIACIEHEFGSGCVPHAEQLANPSNEACRQLAIGLRRRKRELTRHRSECAADLATSYAVGGSEGAAEGLERLREVEAELGSLEIALDETLEMLRPGSDRHAARRTREVLLEIAEARLSAVKEALSAVMEGDTTERFEIKRARQRVTSGSAKARIRVALKMRREK